MTEIKTRPFAVVTGGSNGIGFELALQFVENGHDVLIAAQDPGHLAEAAQRLSPGGGQVLTHASDLSHEDGVDSLFAALQSSGRPIDVLCLNAGVGLGGPFVETDLQRELKMIDLNVRGAVQLTKLVLKGMVARGSGKLLFTSSVEASMPDPFEAIYGSTKVFLRWFGESLRSELKDTGVSVTVLMPGITETNFFKRAEMLDTKAGAMEGKDDPAVVAKAAFDALQAGRDKVVPTAKNKVMSAISEALPEPLVAAAHKVISKPGSAG